MCPTLLCILPGIPAAITSHQIKTKSSKYESASSVGNTYLSRKFHGYLAQTRYGLAPGRPHRNPRSSMPKPIGHGVHLLMRDRKRSFLCQYSVALLEAAMGPPD